MEVEKVVVTILYKIRQLHIPSQMFWYWTIKHILLEMWTAGPSLPKWFVL
jgi:hypothetical protein